MKTKKLVGQAIPPAALLLLFYFPLILCAQAKVAFLDSLSDRMSWYGQSKPSTLYVHLDKNVYAPTEIIWFRAYLIKSSSQLEKNNTLSVALVRMEDRKVCLQFKFLMQQGLSSGNMLLPDSLLPGKYSFIAYTNVLVAGMPQALFIQPIEIRTSASSSERPHSPDSLSASKTGPQTPASPSVRFYPEGGHLVTDLPSVVGWEAKDSNGQAVALSAVLLEDDRPLDSVRTTPSGMGSFRLTPREGTLYQVRLLPTGVNPRVYDLPPAASSGPVISLSGAMTEDTLRLAVESKEQHTYYLLLHDFTQLYKAFTLHATSVITPLTVPMTGLPRGLTALTVLDSLYRPVAERLFFAHTTNTSTLQITLDSAFYHTRSKVQVHLRLQNSHHQPLQGIFSIACVQRNRVNPRLFKSIENYTYLEHDLGQALGTVALGTTNKQEQQYLEDVLLIKGWANYNWQGLLAAKASDTSVAYSSLSIHGNVSKGGKSLKKPVDVFLMNDSSLNTIASTPTGQFTLEPGYLVTTPGRRLNLFLNSKPQGVYKISLEDPYPAWNESLAWEIQPVEAPLLIRQPVEKSYFPAPPGRYKTLATVVVRSKLKDKEFYNRHLHGDPGNEVYEGTCHDWVCLYDFLDCPFHPFGLPPVQGGQYNVYTPEGVKLVVYHDNCKWASPFSTVFYSLDGFKQSRQSYAFDFSELAPDDPQYLTTLYWNASVMLDQNGEASLSFYTSDIPATFKIIVQGRTASDVVSGEANFAVKNDTQRHF